MKKLLARFVSDEQGLELSEYAVLAGLIVVAIIVVVGLIGGNIKTIFEKLNDALSTAAAAAP